MSFARHIPAHYSAVKSVAFSPDGARLLTGAFDDTVKIWDTRSGRPLGALPGHAGRVADARVTPDGRTAVTAADRSLRVWSLPDGKLVRTFEADPAQVYALALSPSGETVASGGSNGQVKIWSVGGDLRTTLTHGGPRVLSVAFSPDGARLVTAGDDRTVKVWDVADWKLRGILAGHTGAISDVAIAPDGQEIASASDDHTAKLWQLDSGHLLATLSLHSDEVWAVAFSPDGGTLVTGGKEPLLGVWSLPTAKLKDTVPLNAASQGTLGLAFSGDGTTLATAHGSGDVGLWRVASAPGATAVPSPTIAESVVPASATPEQRTYADAMALIDSYVGRRAALDQAQAALEGLLAKNPKSALAHAGLARVAYKHGLFGDSAKGYDEALDHVAKALAIDPGVADAYVVRGWVFHERKDDSAARVAVDAARKVAPTSPRMLLLDAELGEAGGDLDGAEKSLRDVLSRPLSRRLAAVALENLANVLGREGDGDGDERVRRKQVELEPESVWAKGNLARVLVYRGDYDGAIAMAQSAVAQMDYGDGRKVLSEAYCAKGQELLWDRNDPERAMQAFQSAGDGRACASYGIGAYHQYLGVTRHDSSQLDEAARWYRKALTEDADDKTAARALSALGR
jgi:tetratricopeptide (TPR) repeat protein